ncbi:hypothetical protein EZZ79_01810 [Pseudomonas syringae]|nr:hypothetical protein EZZ79_01810 [Pseudomonas syringae]
MLAKRPVQTQKTGRLDNRFREQARSHKNLCTTPSASALGRMSSSNMPVCCPRQRLGPVGASLLANRPVQTQKTGRLDNRFREQARSHKNLCTTPSALAWGRMSSLTTAACRPRQRIGPVGASLLANRPVQPQETGRLDNRFREQASSHKACVQRQALQRWGACRHQICRCAAPACRCGKRSVPCGNSFLRKLPSW